MKTKGSKFSLSFKRFGYDPVFDWYFLLLCFSVALVFVVLLDVVFYLKLSTDDPRITAAVSSRETYINRSDIEIVAQKIQDKDTVLKTSSENLLRDPSVGLK